MSIIKFYVAVILHKYTHTKHIPSHHTHRHTRTHTTHTHQHKISKKFAYFVRLSVKSYILANYDAKDDLRFLED